MAETQPVGRKVEASGHCCLLRPGKGLVRLAEGLGLAVTLCLEEEGLYLNLPCQPQPPLHCWEHGVTNFEQHVQLLPLPTQTQAENL